MLKVVKAVNWTTLVSPVLTPLIRMFRPGLSVAHCPEICAVAENKAGQVKGGSIRVVAVRASRGRTWRDPT